MLAEDENRDTEEVIVSQVNYLCFRSTKKNEMKAKAEATTETIKRNDGDGN